MGDLAADSATRTGNHEANTKDPGGGARVFVQG